MKASVCLSRPFLTQSLFYFEQKDILYLHNAKSGCSTVKQAIIKASGQASEYMQEDRLHAKVIHGSGPWWSQAFHKVKPQKTYVFSVVRNPFTRVLSAYLDKICRPGILRNQFMLQNGFDIGAEVSFVQFLRILKKADGVIYDQHWRPQISNLLLGYVPITELFYLENFSETVSDLHDRLGSNTKPAPRKGHATNAAENLRRHLTDEASALVQDIYRDDFEVLGYSKDPADVLSAPSRNLSALPKPSPRSHRSIRLLGMLLTRQPNCKLTELAKAHDLSWFDKALIVRAIHPNSLFDNQQFEADVDRLAMTGTTAERFVAHRHILEFRQNSSVEAREHSARALTAIAPYFVSYRARYAESLLAQSKQKEAKAVIQALEMTTWQTHLVESLRKTEAYV